MMNSPHYRLGDLAVCLFACRMAAWMLGTDDHSLYEIMLGAAPYMPTDAQIIQVSLQWKNPDFLSRNPVILLKKC